MKIKYLNGENSGMVLEFSARNAITIGREEDNRLCLSTGGVSRYHAVLEPLADCWQIRDLNSTNGIKLNGVKISGSAALSKHDQLDIGDSKLEILALTSETESPETPSEAVTPITFQPVITAPEDVPAAPEIIPQPTAAETAEITPPPPTAPVAQPGALLQDFKARSGSLFGGKKTVTPSPEVPAESTPRPRKFSNRFFYIIVAAVAVIGLAAGQLLLKPVKKSAGHTRVKREAPLMLNFTKQIVDRDNVFYFKLELNGKKASFTIDDLRSQRHLVLHPQVTDADLDLLRSRLRASQVARLAPQEINPNARQQRFLSLVDQNKLQELHVSGDVVPLEFEKACSAIDSFAENFGLEAFSRTPEELKEQAQNSFYKAEDLFNNKEAHLSNVREAIKYYRLVISSLDYFVPKPRMWKKARQQLAEAEKFRATRLEQLKFEYRRAAQLRDFTQLRRVFLQQMELADPNSNAYENAKLRLFKIDQYLKKTRR